MEIKDILSKLGLDLTNPEVKRGALEAINAILTSRVSAGIGANGLGGGSQEQEVELDPDLIQPSIKQTQASGSDDDIEIEDDENILGQMKHNKSEEPVNKQDTAGDDSESSNSDNSENTEDAESADEADTADKADDSGSSSQDTDSNDSDKTSPTDDDAADDKDVDSDASGDDETDISNTNGADVDVDKRDSDTSDDSDHTDMDDENNEADGVGGAEEGDSLDDEESTDDFEDFEFDEDDLIDDELKNSTEDEELRTKHEARKIKRERTLAAAKKALVDAKAKKVSASLIRELEKSIEALEALTEAVTKSIKDISDEEFNLLLNRVFDAIDACGGADLTYTSKEERDAQVKEIKADLADTKTQTELSAEDAAQIRAETQAIKAREKESAKYAAKDRSSFRGFQEFLNSLYRAMALQVHNEESRDDSWSAISRRNSGAGVLRQGKKINRLPNKKIPVIDFYFDQSGSWGPEDLEVGKKAVATLAEMEEKGQIKLNVFYFADEVSETPTSGGTSGWNEIVKNVIATQATNVVIMTDDDMQNWWAPQKKPPLRYTVPGYVWYLWRNGENAPRLPQDLKGRGGVQQFSFNINDV